MWIQTHQGRDGKGQTSSVRANRVIGEPIKGGSFHRSTLSAAKVSEGDCCFICWKICGNGTVQSTNWTQN